jgi:hypothetical protein
VLAVGLGRSRERGKAADRSACGEALLEADRLAILTQQMVDQIFKWYLTGLPEGNGFRVERGCGMPRPGSRATAPESR